MDTFTFEMEMTLNDFDMFQRAADILDLSVEQFVTLAAGLEALKTIRRASAG